MKTIASLTKRQKNRGLGRHGDMATWHIWVSFNEHKDGSGGEGVWGRESKKKRIWRRQSETEVVKTESPDKGESAVTDELMTQKWEHWVCQKE